MDNVKLATSTEATQETEGSVQITARRLTEYANSFHEKAVIDALHSAGLSPEDSHRVLSNYRSNVSKRLNALGGLIS